MSPLAAIGNLFYRKNHQRFESHRSRLRRAFKRRRGFTLEPLEPRLLMSADLAYAAGGNTATDLTLTYAAASNQYQLLDS